MSARTPRAADVARWVDDLTAPEPSTWNVEDHKWWKRAKDKGRWMLRSWGLRDDGQPIGAEVSK